MAIHKVSNGLTQKVSKRAHTKGQQTGIEGSSANDHTEKVSKWPHTKGQQTGTYKRSANGHTQKVSKLASGLLDSGHAERCLHYTAPRESKKSSLGFGLVHY